MSKTSAVLLLSGGLDSATVLALAQREGMNVYTLTFRYGQRHAVELQAARKVAEAMGVVEHREVTIDLGAFGGSALTDRAIAVPKSGGGDAASSTEARPPTSAGEIPLTYVPARNTIFLSFALGWAEVLGARDIYAGMNAVDYSGYPDCRPEYLAAYQKMAALATKAGVEGAPVRIHTPLLELSKAEIIRLGHDLGVDYSLTHSCYDPVMDGAACGECESCQLRRTGFTAAGVPDPTRYKS